MLTQKIKDLLLNTEGITPCNGTKSNINEISSKILVQFFKVEGMEGKFELDIRIRDCSRYTNYEFTGETYQYLWGDLTDTVSGCHCGIRFDDIAKTKEETILRRVVTQLKALIKKTPTQRIKVAEREKNKATKRSQKETFEAMITSLGLGSKLTVSRTGKVVKVQVDSDIEKMKKIFAILADRTYEEVEDLYALAQIK
tara:strand:- start:1140 stop:1733 length:594 start_codon:yes stop_codon:yes gene_type:complete